MSDPAVLTVIQGQAAVFTGKIVNPNTQTVTINSMSSGDLPDGPGDFSSFTFLPALFDIAGAVTLAPGGSYSGVLFDADTSHGFFVTSKGPTLIGSDGPFSFDVGSVDTMDNTVAQSNETYYSLQVLPAPEASQSTVFGFGAIGLGGLLLRTRRRKRLV